MAKEKDMEKKGKAKLDKDSKSAKHDKENEPAEQVKAKKSFNKKKLKYGAMSTIITVVVIAVVVVVNLIAGILTERKGLKMDLTEKQYYDISKETIDYIKSLKDDVEISVMSKESSMNTQMGKMVIEMLSKFEQNSDHIAVEYYDIASNPKIISKFSENYSGDIQEGDVVISVEDRVKVVAIDDFFEKETSYYGSSYTGYKGEQELVSALMSVIDTDPRRVAFISMYGEGNFISSAINQYSMSVLFYLLGKNGYEVSEVDIMNSSLSPDDYDMVVLPAPSNDLTESCIEKIENFLYNNGDLDKDMIYIADYTQHGTPNIDAFLEVWGVKVGNSIIYEKDESRSQHVELATGRSDSAPVAQIADESYSEGISNKKLPIVVPLSRPVELLFTDSNVDRTVTAVLQTTDTAYLSPMDDLKEQQAILEAMMNGEQPETEATEAATEFDPDTAEQSVQNLMAVVTKSNMDSDNVNHENNVMVIGGMTLFDAQLAASPSYNNQEFAISAVNKMCGKENNIVIAQKNFNNEKIDIKVSQVKAIRRVVIYIIPLIVVAAGIVVFLKRRNR